VRAVYSVEANFLTVSRKPAEFLIGFMVASARKLDCTA
jgi:hypothetical protein